MAKRGQLGVVQAGQQLGVPPHPQEEPAGHLVARRDLRGPQRVRAVAEADPGDGPLEDRVVEDPFLGGEPVQVDDLVDLHRAEDLQVLLLDVLDAAQP
jgi:hypothetical protein